MPAETHQHSEHIDLASIVELLVELTEVDHLGADARHVTLGELDLDEPLAVDDLWRAVTEEYGERTLGNLHEAFDEHGLVTAMTLDGLARWFHRELTADLDADVDADTGTDAGDDAS
jgi:hypothetical protein